MIAVNNRVSRSAVALGIVFLPLSLYFVIVRNMGILSLMSLLALALMYFGLYSEYGKRKYDSFYKILLSTLHTDNWDLQQVATHLSSSTAPNKKKITSLIPTLNNTHDNFKRLYQSVQQWNGQNPEEMTAVPWKAQSKNIHDTIESIECNLELLRTSNISQLGSKVSQEAQNLFQEKITMLIDELRHEFGVFKQSFSAIGERLASSEEKGVKLQKDKITLEEKELERRKKDTDTKNKQAEAERLSEEKAFQEVALVKVKKEEENKKAAHQRVLNEQEKTQTFEASENEKDRESKFIVAETERKKEELKKQNQLKEFPLKDHLNVFCGRIDEMEFSDVDGKKHSHFFELFTKMKERFVELKMIPFERLEEVSPDVYRINQIETIIDLYGEKIKRVKFDDGLDEEERHMKIDYWIRLRDREISELEE